MEPIWLQGGPLQQRFHYSSQSENFSITPLALSEMAYPALLINEVLFFNFKKKVTKSK